MLMLNPLYDLYLDARQRQEEALARLRETRRQQAEDRRQERIKRFVEDASPEAFVQLFVESLPGVVPNLPVTPLPEDADALYRFRDRAIRDYGYAIPDARAIEIVAQYSPLIEIGAGRGYWAWVLAQAGADVVAYDEAPPGLSPNHHFRSHDRRSWTPPRSPDLPDHFHEVRQGDHRMLDEHPDRTLFVCWGDGLLYSCLERYHGEYLLVVEEECADYIPRKMWDYYRQAPPEEQGLCPLTEVDLRHVETWEVIEEYDLPQWGGIHDTLVVYRRRQRP